ncbi:MAG: hypothetical protein AAGN35_05465 [Bacteroidota bacterium]
MAAFKYRVMYRLREHPDRKFRIVEFQYERFSQAKANYKAILLEFYRRRIPVDWEICLNRIDDPQWGNAIFYDADLGG